METRRSLREESILGECGAVAIRDDLVRQGVGSVPSVRTIGRILERRGALGETRRLRRPPPPRGWYLPEVARGAKEMDSFDVVEGLRIVGGHWVEVLTAISIHGGLPGAWPMETVTSQATLDALEEHWRAVGLPGFAQFDNDMRFFGSHDHRRRGPLGRVTRLCLSLGIDVVFAPPREQGFQAAIEGFNGLWQSKVWTRFHHPTRDALRRRSDLYIAALRTRRIDRVDAAPARRAFPKDWKRDMGAPSKGRVVYLRRTSQRGEVTLLGRTLSVDPQWQHRLVRIDLDPARGHVRIHALRRAAPDVQPLLFEDTIDLPWKPLRKP